MFLVVFKRDFKIDDHLLKILLYVPPSLGINIKEYIHLFFWIILLRGFYFISFTKPFEVFIYVAERKGPTFLADSQIQWVQRLWTTSKVPVWHTWMGWTPASEIWTTQQEQRKEKGAGWVGNPQRWTLQPASSSGPTICLSGTIRNILETYYLWCGL